MAHVLKNHLTTTVSVDFFTVPTIRFQILYVFLGCTTDTNAEQPEEADLFSSGRLRSSVRLR